MAPMYSLHLDRWPPGNHNQRRQKSNMGESHVDNRASYERPVQGHCQFSALSIRLSKMFGFFSTPVSLVSMRRCLQSLLPI